VDRAFLRWLLLVAAVIFGVLWLLTAAGGTVTAPPWVPAAGFLCLWAAAAMP
jgi:hypothetical protein